MTASIIQVGQRTAGVLRPRDDGLALVFYATDPDFETLDGSSFANRHATQKAVERVARLVGDTHAQDHTANGQEKLRV